MSSKSNNAGKKRKSCDNELIDGTNNLVINGSSSSSSSNPASPRASKKVKRQPVRLIFEEIGNDVSNTRAFFSEKHNKMVWKTGDVRVKFKFEYLESASFESVQFFINTERNLDCSVTLSDYQIQLDNSIVGWLNLPNNHTGRVFVCAGDRKVELYFEAINITDKILVVGATNFIKIYNDATKYEQASYITNYSEKVGSGGEAVIYKCYCITGTKNNQSLMIKLYRPKNATNANSKAKAICRDAFMLLYNICQDPDVSKIVPEPIGFFENHHGSICEVHEFIGGGSLLDNINSNKHGWYDSNWNMKDRIAKSIFSQLLFIKKTLKKHDITHRDLSPENFLVQHVQGQLPILYVIDFGHAKGMVDELHGICGKNFYNSPELFEHVETLRFIIRMKMFDQHFVQKKDYNLSAEKYDHRTDNFSLGQVLYAVLTRRQPDYNEIGRAEVLKGVRNNIFVDIINGLLLRDPNDRWSAERALSYLDNGVDTKPEVASDLESEVMEFDSTLMLSTSDLLNVDQY
jgi:hypothetical protein